MALPPPPPLGDPRVGLADVEWAMEIGDYKVADGLNWPHRFITTVDGRNYRDMRLGRFKINQKIDERKFRVR